MKLKITDLVEEIKKVLEKYISTKEISTFIKKVNNTQKQSGELPSSQLRLVTDQVISFAEKKLPVFNFLNFLKDLGKFYISHGELELASDISNSILSFTKKDKRLSSITAYAFLNFGEIFISKAMWTEGTTYIKKAFSFFYKENDPVGLARCESLMGTLYAEKGQLSSAMTHFHKGFSYVNESKDVSVSALLENNIGIVYNIRGDYNSAYTYFHRALIHFEGLKDSQRVARIRHNLGMLFLKKKEYTSALKEFDTSISVSLAKDYYPTLAISYISKASIYCTLNDDTLADALADRGMEISSQINDKLTIAEVYKIKGILERKKKRYDIAQNYFMSSLRLNKELGSELNYAETAVELGILFAENKQKDNAKNYFSEALKYYKKIKAVDEIERIKVFL
ncbi:MAG: tetratricopeptide repeat protein [Ignavibacteria bacterium]|nr:tetratricopeptide repeat protein [Ignavibacteria bacterium]